MEDLKSKAANLSDSISDYIETKYKLTVVNAADKVSGIAASTLSSLVMLVMGFFVILFLGIALGIWLGELVNNAALGYVLVAAVFLVIIFIVVSLSKKIVFPMIRNKIINKIYEPHD
jgi:hypothetical protein